MASDTTPKELLNARLLSVPPTPQSSSLLFNLTPPEIRAEIFSLVLADFPDPAAEKQYATDSCCKHPLQTEQQPQAMEPDMNENDYVSM
jgi:hypothetical protein